MRIKLLILISLILLIGVVTADTSIIYTTNATDGYAQRLSYNTTYTDLRNGAGTLASSASSVAYSRITDGLSTNTYTDNLRGILIFDTSTIPPSSTIDSSGLSINPTLVYKYNRLINMSLTKFNTEGTIDAADYNNFDYDVLSDEKNVSSLTNNVYTTFALNSLGKTNITKGGITGFGVLTENDYRNTTPSPWQSIGRLSGLYFKTSDNVVNTPYLTIEWTPDTTPPSSITNLSNNTALCSEVTWTWDNPTDPDYAYLYTLKNNAWTGNYSNSTSASTWLTLNELTSYTFSSHTVDLDGNMNLTWVNRTVATPICPVTPITSFTSNVTCGNLPTVAVQFNDTSNNNGYAITGYNWTFGDGNTSTLQNPVNTYKVAGAYWVNHSAGNVAGATWSNVSRYMIVVPDWGTCAPASSGNVYYISNSQETPVAIVIPIVAILLLVMWVRRK
jgi:hypothetical protein